MAQEKVFTNISANPVALSDGSLVEPGGQTTAEKYELVKGSLWAEHGVLVAGAPVLASADSQQLADLQADNDSLRKQLADVVAAGHEKDGKLADLQVKFDAQAEQLKVAQAKSK